MKNLHIGQIIFPLLLIKLLLVLLVKTFKLIGIAYKERENNLDSYIMRRHITYGTFWGINGSKKFFQDNFKAKTVMVP